MSKLTLDEAIKHCHEVAEKNECKMTSDDGYTDVSMKQCAADHRQLAEWLLELKDLREENEVLMQECDRLIKEKGELLSKVSGGDVLRICQLEEQLEKAKRLLKMAVEDIYKECTCNTWGCGICEHLRETCDYDDRFTWRHKTTVLKLIGETNDKPR